jgi:hypothetical protein
MIKSDSTSIPEVPFPGVGDRAEHHGTCHDALEVYDYSCFIIVDEKSAHEILQLAPPKVLLPSDNVDPPHECAY